jgi:alkyl sulfatase BDS1-like metallo-beta-lactamase superfamily hydrolase
MSGAEKPASSHIEALQERVRATMPWADAQDFDDARRGFIGALEPAVVRGASGAVIWDNDAYSFLDEAAPASANPSLWRQSQLNAIQGLFEVVPGIYQVRGLDLSNMTVVEGDTGIVVIDPLISRETAAAALALYREHRGDRTVVAVIYTHSHVDHFGGVKGVTTQEEVDAGRCAVIAPAGFAEHAVSENVYAGTAMARRAGYMYGAALPKGPLGQVGAGLGQTTSTGEVTLIVRTLDITETGQEVTVDGVRMVFQMAPGSEAPAEMHFFFPDFGALCMAENATHTLHNTLTLRGALVRDPHIWAGYLTEAIDLFGDRAEVAFASHHWPTWGKERVHEFLSVQRDMYAYLHDQTLRLLNRGFTGMEIAETFELPPALQKVWHTHGYYGSYSHNVKAVYQRYMGWFDGNPAHLWMHPPVAAGERYVEFMGGADEVVRKARGSFDAGDYRWAAEVLNHVVFADPSHTGARDLLADTYEQLGYGAENGTWRNFYLSGAHELRHGSFGTPGVASSLDIVSALTPTMCIDAMAISVDGPRCWDEDLRLDLVISDEAFRVTLRNGVLTHTTAPQHEAPQATLRLAAPQLAGLLVGALGPEDLAAGGATLEGDAAAVLRLFTALVRPDPDFPIVTPRVGEAR